MMVNPSNQNNYRKSPHGSQANLNPDTDKKLTETGLKALDLGATGGTVTAAIESGEQIPVVGGAVTDAKNELIDKVSPVVTKTLDTADKIPGLNLRDRLNDANKAGTLDSVNSGLSMAGGGGGSNLNSAASLSAGGRPPVAGFSPMDSSTPEIESISGTQDMMGDVPEVGQKEEADSGAKKKDSKSRMTKLFNAPIQAKLAVACITFFFVLLVPMIVMGANLGATADLTSGGGYGPGGPPGASQEMFTNEQIEGMMIYVGDSRILGVQSALGNQNVQFIAQGGADYNWFISEGRAQLEELLTSGNRRFVVIALGAHDITNHNRYINLYRSLVSSFSEVSFYFLSVNPVDEALAAQNNYHITNNQIESFNNAMRAALGPSFINSFNAIQNILQTDDGFHLDNTSNRRLHEIVVGQIRRDNPISNSFDNIPDMDITYSGSPTYSVGRSSAFPNLSPLRGRFGQFPYNNNAPGRMINQDPAWVNANIITINFPCAEINANVRIHRVARPNFEAAFTNVCRLVTTGINGITLNPSDVIFGGAYVSRKTSAGGYSLHAYGIAIDMNPNWSTIIGGQTFRPYAGMGRATHTEYQRFIAALGGNQEDPRNVNYVLWRFAFQPAGFNWGGNWSVRNFDPMHFEVNWR